MFGIDWSDPQTLWLNLTNLALGVVTLVALAAVGYGIVWDLIEKRRAPSPHARELPESPGGLEARVFQSPELGLTMADGGEPEPPKRPSRRKSR